jgi:ceramide glucosyltransferase
LKPLAGLDDGLHVNLRSFFCQDYSAFEILFGVRDMSDPAVAVVTSLQRQFPQEAPALNTDLLSGILVSRMLEGMKVAVGATIAARRWVLEGLGNFDRFKEYLAEDFVMVKFAAEAGHGVILSSYVVEHHIGSAGLVQSLCVVCAGCEAHADRGPQGIWVSCSPCHSRSRCLSSAAEPSSWLPVPLALLVRGIAAYVVSACVLRTLINWRLLLEELTGFCFWLIGFFYSNISWRGRRHHLYPDGRFELVRLEIDA